MNKINQILVALYRKIYQIALYCKSKELWLLMDVSGLHYICNTFTQVANTETLLTLR